jgi:hypothetical protein
MKREEEGNKTMSNKTENNNNNQGTKVFIRFNSSLKPMIYSIDEFEALKRRERGRTVCYNPYRDTYEQPNQIRLIEPPYQSPKLGQKISGRGINP